MVVIDGPDAGRAVPLDGPKVAGTAATVDLILSDDRVSSKHVRITPVDARFLVKDLESTNGTFFEGSKLQELELSPGASLKIGRSTLRIEPSPRTLDVRPSASRRFGELVGESLAMREIFAVLELAARSDATVLVRGETGTGKELVARSLHDASGRRKGPFVAVDCGALPESLLDSELFGHVKGAFTGAQADRKGAFVRADGGTLFLDELGRVNGAVQARLLRVLEERKVKPVGADAERPVDVRVIAATPANLDAAVANGSFRSDLYYRLSVIAFELPPLKSRREDIPLIVAELLRRRGLETEGIEGPNLDRLKSHRWPGNVRELRNVIDRALVLAPGARRFSELKISLEASVGSGEDVGVRTDLPYKDAKDVVLESFERTYLRELMARHRDNLSAAAREADVDRKHWRTLLKKHGLFDGPDED